MYLAFSLSVTQIVFLSVTLGEKSRKIKKQSNNIDCYTIYFFNVLQYNIFATLAETSIKGPKRFGQGEERRHPMTTQKNNTLELLKLFASYMVVFIHIPFVGKAGVATDALARFAVPFFFFVSGYYSYQISCEKIKKRIQNILSLLIISTISYTAFEIIRLLKYDREGLVTFFNNYTDLSAYTELLIFNVPVNFGHLWYLLAIFYVYIIFYFVTLSRVKEKVIFTVSLPLLLLPLLLGEGFALFGTVLPLPLVRNFATMGIPFFALGLFVKKHQNKFLLFPKKSITLYKHIFLLLLRKIPMH